MGAEAGADFGFTHLGSGLSLDARGRMLLVHQEKDFKEWGAAVALRIQPGREAGASGLSLSLEPSWGNASGGAQTLWQGGSDVWRSAAGVPALGAADPGWAPDRLSMEVGYGVLLPGGRQIKPFGR